MTHLRFHALSNSLTDLVSVLEDNSQDGLVIRLPPLSARLDHKEETVWRNSSKKLEIDHGMRSFEDALRSSKVVVFTYFSTGFLQCLSSDQPTLGFWELPIETVLPDAQEIFRALVDAKILFSDAREAAEHLSRVERDIGSWWMSDDVIAKKQFCDMLARGSSNPIKEFSELIYK